MLELKGKTGHVALGLSVCAALSTFAISITADCDKDSGGGCDREPPPRPPPEPVTIYIAAQSDVEDLPPTDGIKPLLGVNAGPIPVRGGPDLTAGYEEIGVTVVRTDELYDLLDVSVLYPDVTVDPGVDPPEGEPGPFQWEPSVTAFQTLADLGFGPYFRLGESTGGAEPPSEADEDRKFWNLAIVEILRHLTLDLPVGYSLKIVEVWDEPDGAPAWPDGISAFAELFASVVRAVNEGLPTLTVGGPGFSKDMVGSSELIEFVETYNDLDDGLPGTRIALQFDFLSWHMFSSDPDDFVEAARTYHGLFWDDVEVPDDVEHDFSILDQIPALHVTAWNLADEDLHLLDDPEGAALLTAIWIAMQGDDDLIGEGVGDNEEYSIAQAFFYKGGDDEVVGNRGLFTATGEPKVAARTFQLWSEFVADHGEQRFFTSEDPIPKTPLYPTVDFLNGLWCLTGRGSGGVGVLIANLGGAKRWELNRTGSGVLAADRLTVTHFADDGTLETFTPEESEVEIGERRMMLVRVADY